MRSSPEPAMEEFQEADVLWPEHHRDDHGHGHGHHQQQQHRGRQSVHVDAARAAQQLHGGAAPRLGSSAPVGIPVMRSTTEPAATAWARSYDNDGGDGTASASFLPPHEIAARRRCSEEQAAFSVCVGHGRTLKGRDLRSVRTAVLRMTGFLES